jgi:hypothetical protein
MEIHFNLLNPARPLTGMVIASGGGTSFHLQPKVAATDCHRSLSFRGMRAEFGHAGESRELPRRTSRLSSASDKISSTSGKISLASGISGCISELSVAKSEELSKANVSSGVSSPSPAEGLS